MKEKLFIIKGREDKTYPTLNDALQTLINEGHKELSQFTINEYERQTSHNVEIPIQDNERWLKYRLLGVLCDYARRFFHYTTLLEKHRNPYAPLSEEIIEKAKASLNPIWKDVKGQELEKISNLFQVLTYKQYPLHHTITKIIGEKKDISYGRGQYRRKLLVVYITNIQAHTNEQTFTDNITILIPLNDNPIQRIEIEDGILELEKTDKENYELLQDNGTMNFTDEALREFVKFQMRNTFSLKIS